MIEEKLNQLARRLDDLSGKRPALLFAAVVLAMVAATLLLAMGDPPAVVYQAF